MRVVGRVIAMRYALLTHRRARDSVLVDAARDCAAVWSVGGVGAGVRAGCVRVASAAASLCVCVGYGLGIVWCCSGGGLCNVAVCVVVCVRMRVWETCGVRRVVVVHVVVVWVGRV